MKISRLGVMVVLMLMCEQLFAVPVSGRVVDFLGRPVPFNVVTVSGEKIGCNADSEGFFNLDLPPGEHVLVFRGLGFNSFTETITVQQKGSRMVVFLEPSEEDVHENEFLQVRMNHFMEGLRAPDWEKRLVPGPTPPSHPGLFIEQLP